MATGTTFIDEDPERFTVTSNDFMEDPRLSFKAKGMMVYLKGRPPGWQPQVFHLATVSADGRTAIETGLQELIEFGYMRRELLREDNRIAGTGYRFSWRPLWADDPDRFGARAPKSRSEQQPDFLVAGNQVPEIQAPENPRRISTDLVTTEEESPQAAIEPPLPLELPPGADFVAAARSSAPKRQRMRRAIPTDADPDAVRLAEHVTARFNALMEAEGSDRRGVVSATAVEDARLLMTTGPISRTGDDEIRPVPFEKAMALVDFVFDHPTFDSSGFRWANQMRSGIGLRKNYLNAKEWALSKRAAPTRRPGNGGYVSAEWRPGDPSMVATNEVYDYLTDLETNPQLREDLAAAGVDVDARIAELRAERQGVSV